MWTSIYPLTSGFYYCYHPDHWLFVDVLTRERAPSIVEFVWDDQYGLIGYAPGIADFFYMDNTPGWIYWGPLGVPEIEEQIA